MFLCQDENDKRSLFTGDEVTTLSLDVGDGGVRNDDKWFCHMGCLARASGTTIRYSPFMSYRTQFSQVFSHIIEFG